MAGATDVFGNANRETNVNPSETANALATLLEELFDGPGQPGPWVLDGDAPGLIALLRVTSAEVASSPSITGRRSIAAHAGHLLYSLSLLNRWANGEPNPFATADWVGSWDRGSVTDVEWQDLVDALETAARDWIAAVRQPREWDPIALTGTLASAPHIAYHLGAIRQLLPVDTAPSDAKTRFEA